MHEKLTVLSEIDTQTADGLTHPDYGNFDLKFNYNRPVARLTTTYINTAHFFFLT